MKPLLTALIAALAFVARANAQPVPDHLKCYKVKDPQPKATYTADLGGLVAEPGCTIKVPATMACVPATKTNVTPPPPGGGGTGTPNSFFCYKVKCPKATLPTLAGADQFGSRTVTPSAAKPLCAPLAGSPPPTTTTTTMPNNFTCDSQPFPVCGGTCPEGTTCRPFRLVDSSGTHDICNCGAISATMCMTPQLFACNAGPCPSGGVCTFDTTVNPTTCGCNPITGTNTSTTTTTTASTTTTTMAATCSLPATGQTTCWNSSGTVIPCAGTGHDGDLKKGAALAYMDNGDGTITDVNTGLIWEKQGRDGSVHDVSNTYTWDQAFSAHVATLNTVNFASHNDWRVPNVRELQSIANYETFNPAVSPAFNTNCTTGCTVTSCSCTGSGGYWSSSSDAAVTSLAWLVSYSDGGVVADNGVVGYVRGVRGGS